MIKQIQEVSYVRQAMGKADISKLPEIHTELPGPKSREYHQRAAKYMKGYSSQVPFSRLFSNPAKVAR